MPQIIMYVYLVHREMLRKPNHNWKVNMSVGPVDCLLVLELCIYADIRKLSVIMYLFRLVPQ